jgi:hypothetical protein
MKGCGPEKEEQKKRELEVNLLSPLADIISNYTDPVEYFSDLLPSTKNIIFNYADTADDEAEILGILNRFRIRNTRLKRELQREKSPEKKQEISEQIKELSDDIKVLNKEFLRLNNMKLFDLVPLYGPMSI